MEHIAAVLLLVACSDNLADCREVPAPEALYETVDACETERPFIVGDLAGKAPRIIGTCVYVDPALEEADAELVWDITPGGVLQASIETPDYSIASSGDVPVDSGQ